MKIYTIDYKKHWGKDGTVYNQTVKIDAELMQKFNDDLQLKYDRINWAKSNGKTLNDTDAKIAMYTDKLQKGVNFLHLTGLYYFNLLCFTLDLDKKTRLFFNRNTIIDVL